jgi:serine/threonine-protein kinase
VGPGSVLGEYQLLTLLGTGGMGRVWAARQVGSLLHRLVAIKTTIGGENATADFDRLFLDEARIASQIRHPNVCGVYELGQHEGVLYQVMEWCDGASLRELLDRLPERRMPPALAARLLAKVAAGLHAAHELEDDDGKRMHVVHRDVSPQNVLISRSGQVKLTDFGVAKAYGQLHRPTETGEIKGKIAYMAPEQITTMEVDRRTDVFALGCVLYEATTGRTPFRGDGALSTLYQLLSQEVVSPCSLEPSYPPQLAEVVLKALQRDPNERYQTAEQLSVALEAWLFESITVVTEQAIAALVADRCSALIEDRTRRIDQALAELTPPPSEEAPPSDAPDGDPPEETLTGREAPTSAAAPPVSVSREAVSREVLPEPRPTIPAAPAARRSE